MNRTLSEELVMTLMRVRRAAQLTLPAEVRQALNIQEGDYLEAQIVEGGVLLKPISVVERTRAWQRIEDTLTRVRDLAPNPKEDNATEEQKIADEVSEHRRKRKHA
jgi:AbrB family looped-hinge helix DNA binding protein